MYNMYTIFFLRRSGLSILTCVSISRSVRLDLKTVLTPMRPHTLCNRSDRLCQYGRHRIFGFSGDCFNFIVCVHLLFSWAAESFRDEPMGGPLLREARDSSSSLVSSSQTLSILLFRQMIDPDLALWWWWEV
jgi:hypothetical protein